MTLSKVLSSSVDIPEAEILPTRFETNTLEVSKFSVITELAPPVTSPSPSPSKPGSPLSPLSPVSPFSPFTPLAPIRENKNSFSVPTSPELSQES